MDYDILYETDYETVVAKYEDKRTGNKSYQSEKELEIELIENLKKLGYEYINIKNEKELIDNFKNQLERLNNYKFENDEWNIFFQRTLTYNIKPFTHIKEVEEYIVTQLMN